MFFEPVDNSSASNKEFQNEIDKYYGLGPHLIQEQKKIRPLSLNHGNLGRILLDLRWCYERTKHESCLSPVERIMVESMWTDSLLSLLSIGNSTVMRSIYYRLEQTPEDKEAEV